MAEDRSLDSVGSFAAFQQSYLLQYIGFGDLRAGAVLAAIFAGMTFFFTRSDHQPLIFTGLDWFEIVKFGWVGFAVIAVGAFGVALCPIPNRLVLPARTDRGEIPAIATGTSHHTKPYVSVTHYLDVAHYRSAGHYIAAVLEAHGIDRDAKIGLVREELRECYQLALILRKKYVWILAGYVMAAMAMISLFIDLMLVGHTSMIVGFLILVCIGAVFGALWWFVESDFLMSFVNGERSRG